MSILTDVASKKEAKGNALVIGQEARSAKAKDNSIIDSTIGMLYGEDSKFFTFKTVEKAMNELSGPEKFSYGSTIGSPQFHEAIYSWVFRQYLDEFRDNTNLRCVATPGGTGALACVIANYLSEGNHLILPNYMWTNYIQMVQERNCGYFTYDLFDENGGFNLQSLEATCLRAKKEDGRVVILINDPCENPTGYTMSYSEWIGVYQIIDNISRDGTPVVLIYDMAYVDYDKRGFEKSRNNMRLFSKFNENVLTAMCFSGSKTLGLYGLRVGAVIGVTKSKEAADEFQNACEFTGRGIWSGVSTLGQSVITKVLTTYKNEFNDEIEVARKLLIDRAEAFISESKKVGLYHLPYDCGFFVTIPVNDPHKVYDDLKKKGLYILPIQHAIRLTLSSITLEEVIRAVHIIKETI